MNEIHSPVRDRGECAPASATVLAEASDILATLLKALKAYRLYLPSHRLLREFVRAFFDRLEDHLRFHGDLSLRVARFQILVGAEPIYENQTKEDSLAFRLFTHGIREVTFHSGVSLDQVSSFLQVLHRSFDNQCAAEDLLANLWEKGFPHINFIIVEDLFPELVDGRLRSAAPNRSPSEVAAVRAPGLTFAADSLPSVDVMDLTRAEGRNLPDLLSLTHSEKLALADWMRWETERDLLPDLADLLPSALRSSLREDQEAAPTLFRAAIEALLLKGHLKPAVTIHSELKALAGTASPDCALGVKSRRRLAAPYVLQALKPHLTETPLRNVQALTEFLADLGPALIPGLADCLPEPALRAGALQILRRLAPLHPPAFLRLLGDDRAEVLKPILRILADEGSPASLRAVQPHVQHPDPQVRREAVLCIQKTGTPAFPLLCEVLNGQEPELRILAARALETLPAGPYLAPLLDMARGKTFHQRSFLEQNAILLALGRLEDPHVEEFLLSLLRRRSWFQRGRDANLRSAAVTALARRSSPRALAAIESLVDDRSPEVRRAVLLALRPKD